jgi:uncharacterized protein (TIGR02001 family)
MTKTKSIVGLVGTAGVALLALSTAASADGSIKDAPADEGRQFAWSVTIGGTSDYVFRGLSLNDEDPAFQASIDASYGIFYVGAWGSNITGEGYEPWELDLYAGIKPVLGQFTFDFGVIGYLYPGADDPLEYIEFKAGVSTEIFKGLTGGVIFYATPDQDNYAETWTVEGSLAYALPQFGVFSPTVSGGVGYSEDTDFAGAFSAFTDNYVYWNAGLSLGVEKLTLDFRYWDTDLDQIPGDLYTGLSEERFVFSAKVVLP